MNGEDKYSIRPEGWPEVWPEGREPPLGWRSAGKAGTQDDCLACIEQVWTDMRPLSLRRTLDGAGS
jgi:MbtH protein